MRVVLGDGQRLFIDSLAAALSGYGFTVAAVATSPQELFSALDRHQPDICLLAARFPACSGLDVLRVIRGRHPGVRVVILSAGPDPGVMAAAAEGGAFGYLPRSHRIADITYALRRVLEGERVFDTELPGTVARSRSSAGDAGNWLDGALTVREQQVLLQIMDGVSTRQIAQSLGIAESTTRTHIQNVLAKLGVHSRLEAITVAAGPGLRDEQPAGLPAARIAGSG
jgi:two-component system, NarL family, nitrate/nitrite response regulator NarL